MLRRRIDEVCAGICAALGAAYTIEMDTCTPTTSNSEEGARLMQEVATAIVGEGDVVQIPPMMVGEDMAEFLNRAPGCFVLVGAAHPERGYFSPHHSPTFDFEESVMPTGVALLAQAAFSHLSSGRAAGASR